MELARQPFIHHCTDKAGFDEFVQPLNHFGKARGECYQLAHSLNTNAQQHILGLMSVCV